MFLTPYEVQLRWSDLDPNFHLRHSSYYDIAAQHRMDVLKHYGLTITVMEAGNFAPVLLREECAFIKEIRADDNVKILLKLDEVVNSGIKWTFVHEFINNDNQRLARLTAQVAWFNLKTRRFARPLPDIVKKFHETIILEMG